MHYIPVVLNIFPFKFEGQKAQYVTSVRSCHGCGASIQRQQCEDLQKLSTEQMSAGNLNAKPGCYIQLVALLEHSYV